MITHENLVLIAKAIPAEKRMVFAPIRQDKFDEHYYIDTSCCSGCIDSVFVNIRKIQDLIPDWHANNLVLGIVKFRLEAVDE